MDIPGSSFFSVYYRDTRSLFRGKRKGSLKVKQIGREIDCRESCDPGIKFEEYCQCFSLVGSCLVIKRCQLLLSSITITNILQVHNIFPGQILDF